MSTRLKKTLSIIIMCLIMVWMIPATPSFAQSQWTFSYSGNIVNWTAPYNGTYRIEVWGAQGGDGWGYADGGKGARMRGDFTLSQGTVLKILVGQKGRESPVFRGTGGGGGGTFVAKSDNTPLIVAGGGGGANGYGSDGRDGRADIGNGNGGKAGENRQCGGGGGGFNTDGSSGEYTAGGRGGKSFVNGGEGGPGGTYRDDDGGDGGFGGGGGGGGGDYGYDGGGGGGGGGYQGGAGGRGYRGGAHINDYPHPGDGGLSYNDGTNQSNSSGVRTGNGSATITPLSISDAPSIISPVPGSKYQEPSLSASFPGSVYFHWQYSTNGSTFYDITTTSSSLYEWTIPESISDGTEIHLRVRAEAGSAISPWSTPVVIIKGIDDLLGARLAAEAAAQAANEAKIIAAETKEAVQAVAQNIEQLDQRLVNIEDLIKGIATNNIQLSWDNNKTATSNNSEWLNISAIGSNIEYRYRVNEEPYGEWDSFLTEYILNSAPTQAIRMSTFNSGTGAVIC